MDRGGSRRLERIAEYLSAHAPDRAPALVTSIYESPRALLSFPHRGRPGKKARTRELALSPLPWIVVYEVRGRCRQGGRILHEGQGLP